MYRIVIGSCVLNIVIQMIYDIIIFVRGANNFGSCDLVLLNEFANELVWFIARSNACSLWILPVLYVFMPPIRCWKKKLNQLKRKLKIREKNRRSDLNNGDSNPHDDSSYIETDDLTDDDSEFDESEVKAVQRKTTARKKKDSILGGLETDNSYISEDADNP